ncbi:MAG: hypothetical protein IAE94_02570, partial [Chthoniobacterales bacterium]|nr:hypothetical protein [Chthoniobacterales bacterium]
MKYHRDLGVRHLTLNLKPSRRPAQSVIEESTFHFHRIFKRLTGLTPKAYAAAHRAKKVRRELSRSGSVTKGWTACSRWSSAAIPPVCHGTEIPHPGGTQIHPG